MQKLLIIVDFQNDFVEGSLGFKRAVDLENVIYHKILSYKNRNDDIIYTLDTHDKDYLSTREGKNLPIIHCLKGSIGHQLYGKVRELIDEKAIVFEKSTYGSLELANYLIGKDYQEIELCGLVSNICVLSNAVLVASALPNAKIIVDALATASGNQDLHQKTLDILKGIHVEIINE